MGEEADGGASPRRQGFAVFPAQGLGQEMLSQHLLTEGGEGYSSVFHAEAG